VYVPFSEVEYAARMVVPELFERSFSRTQPGTAQELFEVVFEAGVHQGQALGTRPYGETWLKWSLLVYEPK
jgi:hypothetical protein